MLSLLLKLRGSLASKRLFPQVRSWNVVRTAVQQPQSKAEILNVAKPVLLYSNARPRFFKYFIMFAGSQGFMFLVLGNSMLTLRSVPISVKPDDPWYKRINLGDSKIRYSLAILLGTIAAFPLVACVYMSHRYIRLLYLMKGGQKVQIVTFNPLPMFRKYEVPVRNIASTRHRREIRTFLALEVAGKRTKFILDLKNGLFHNIQLYDAAISMKFTRPRSDIN